MNKTPSRASRAIIVPEIEQFGGAERSVLALSRWLYQQRLENHLVTYFDHLDLSRYASHPITIVQLRPEPGPRAKVKALRRYFKEVPPDSPKPLGSGYQAALHATLAGVRGFHTLMHDTACLFGDEDVRSAMGKLRIAVSNRIIGYGLRSGGKTIVTSEFLKSECRRDFGVKAEIVRMGGAEVAGNVSPLRIRPVDDRR